METVSCGQQSTEPYHSGLDEFILLKKMYWGEQGSCTYIGMSLRHLQGLFIHPNELLIVVTHSSTIL